jgi:hypothetical protein
VRSFWRRFFVRGLFHWPTARSGDWEKRSCWIFNFRMSTVLEMTLYERLNALYSNLPPPPAWVI